MVSLADVLAAPEFSLIPLTDFDAESVELNWAHTSDLANPAPWLASGQLLLTNGPQFADWSPSQTQDYVASLVAAGIVGLGFARGVVRPDVPRELVAACRERGLPLIEIPPETPFIAISQFVARTVAAAQQAQLQRIVSVQRAIARAALKPDALQGVVVALETSLNCWAQIIDASGEFLLGTQHDDPEVAAQARRLLRSGKRSAARLETESDTVLLQTIGQSSHLRGVIAIGSTEQLPGEATEILESVMAIASVALEQSEARFAALRKLRTALLQLVESDARALAETIAREIWGGFPAAAVQVALVGLPDDFPVLLEEQLELATSRQSGRMFYAVDPEANALAVIAEVESMPAVVNLLTAEGFSVGLSSPGALERFGSLRAEAGIAAEQAAAASCVQFDPSQLGVVQAVSATREVRVLTAHIRELFETQRPELLESLRTWLECNGEWQLAAHRLGVHRHTLRNRIDAVEKVLGRSLDSADVRFELWAALR